MPIVPTWSDDQLRDPQPIFNEGMAEFLGVPLPRGGLRPIPPEQFEQAQRELRAAMADREPKLKNGAAVAAFRSRGSFVYRGREYLVPPLSYQAGIDLQLIAQRMKPLQHQEATPEHLGSMGACLADLARVFRANCRPRSLWRRLVWVLGPNPFRSMSESEAGQLHGFFWQCRMRSGVRCDYGWMEHGETST
jgi:hypothetical protein